MVSTWQRIKPSGRIAAEEHECPKCATRLIVKDPGEPDPPWWTTHHAEAVQP